MPVVRAMQTDMDLENTRYLAFRKRRMRLSSCSRPATPLIRYLRRSKKRRREFPAVDTADFVPCSHKRRLSASVPHRECPRELAEILTAPLEQWRIFLHPKQRQLVRVHANGPGQVSWEDTDGPFAWTRTSCRCFGCRKIRHCSRGAVRISASSWASSTM